uniref:Uncharacterized protein n=1 Tax=Arundo donax TaxID=35708 RepID=A0A0A9EBW9_ARUDO
MSDIPPTPALVACLFRSIFLTCIVLHYILGLFCKSSFWEKLLSRRSGSARCCTSPRVHQFISRLLEQRAFVLLSF